MLHTGKYSLKFETEFLVLSLLWCDSGAAIRSSAQNVSTAHYQANKILISEFLRSSIACHWPSPTTYFEACFSSFYLNFLPYYYYVFFGRRFFWMWNTFQTHFFGPAYQFTFHTQRLCVSWWRKLIYFSVLVFSRWVQVSSL